MSCNDFFQHGLTHAQCPTPPTASLRDLDAVLGLTGDVPCWDKEAPHKEAACDLASFLDDEMFDALFDSSDMEKLLEPSASPFLWPAQPDVRSEAAPDTAVCTPPQPPSNGETASPQFQPARLPTERSAVQPLTNSRQPPLCSQLREVQQSQAAPPVHPCYKYNTPDMYSPSLRVRTQMTHGYDACNEQRSPGSASSCSQLHIQALQLQQASRLYQVQFGADRRIRLLGACLLNIKPMLTNLFGLSLATCTNLPGTCGCPPGVSLCGCPLPPTVVAFDSPPLDQEQYEYIMSTLRHRHRCLLDPDYDDLRPLPDRVPLPNAFQPRDLDGSFMAGPLVYSMGKTHNHGRLYFASFDPVHNTIKRFLWADGLDPFSEEARMRGERAERRAMTSGATCQQPHYQPALSYAPVGYNLPQIAAHGVGW